MNQQAFEMINNFLCHTNGIQTTLHTSRDKFFIEMIHIIFNIKLTTFNSSTIKKLSFPSVLLAQEIHFCKTYFLKKKFTISIYQIQLSIYALKLITN